MVKCVEYDFPGVIRAAKPRSGVERPVVCRMKGRSVLREVRPEEAPVAVIVKRRDARSKFRAYGESLFATVGHIDRIDKLSGSNRLLRRARIEQRMFLEAAVALDGFKESQLWPEGVKITLDVLRSSAPFEHEATDLFKRTTDVWGDVSRLPEPESMNRTENTAIDIAERLAYADALVTGSIIVCEGRVLAKVPEPCLAVAPVHPARSIRLARVSQGDVAFYGRREIQPRLDARSLDLYWSDLDDACFSLAELDQAQEHARAIMSDYPTGTSSDAIMTDIEKIEIFDTSLLTHDFRRHELTRLADRVYYHATRATRMPSRTRVLRKNVPEHFLEAVLGFEARLDPDTGDIEQIEDALEDMLVALAENREEIAALGVNIDRFTRAIGRGLERWDNRPIEFEAANGLFAFGKS